VNAPHYKDQQFQELRERNYATFIRGGTGINFGHEKWWPHGVTGLFDGGPGWLNILSEAPSPSNPKPGEGGRDELPWVRCPQRHNTNGVVAELKETYATIIMCRLHSPCLLQRRVRRHFVVRFAFSAS